MSRIKAGIIGTGFIGPAHIEALRRLGFVEVAAVSERDQALADRKAAELSIPKGYGDYKQLLADPEIQVVHNCTPNHLHFGVNCDIIAAGKHVISEKPLAMNSTESRELVNRVEKAGVINAINFNYRYMPLVQQARAMCQNHDDVGRVLAVQGSYLQDWLFKETDWNWRLVPELSGDSRAIADVGSHWCDLIQYVTGLKITRVMADLVTLHPTRKRPKVEVETYAGKVLKPEEMEDVAIGTEDYASVLLEFDSGAHGVLTVNQCAAGRKNRLFYEINGSKCGLSWDQEKPNELWIGHRDRPNEVMMKDPSLLYPEAREYAHYPGGHNEAYPDGPKNLFRNVYGFIAGTRKGGDFATFLDGHNEIAICDAVLKSSRAKQWVDVEY
ncbi:Gfo/Idh/MocA family protein [Lacipirellula limnantheis]|uniref:1,5-anhydro-D-fructose reductase n=1 Tax=Lacipirellula limnantheis TaxID=2528024 RepID=A0A517TST3_9BACT|nr:Gfo/Idh/MocA family oxidoreductase [Lacipirellula limnantheis]QDT71434.1 1,5-anhydro-D-fructose reductase [Lacipirellula limnantheis]